MSQPKVGEIYEDPSGLRRVVHAVEPFGSGSYYVSWGAPGRPPRAKPSWCSTWEAWAIKAKLVSPVQPSGGAD
jgi:hypothetical protein